MVFFHTAMIAIFKKSYFYSNAAKFFTFGSGIYSDERIVIRGNMEKLYFFLNKNVFIVNF